MHTFTFSRAEALYGYLSQCERTSEDWKKIQECTVTRKNAISLAFSYWIPMRNIPSKDDCICTLGRNALQVNKQWYNWFHGSDKASI